MPVSLESPVFLEIKRKTGNIVTKRRVLITHAQVLEYIEHRAKPPNVDYMTRQIMSEFDTLTMRYKFSAKQYISYKRLAFVDSDDFRLTFDRQILGDRHNLSFETAHADTSTEIIGNDLRVMEVKVDHAFPKWLTDIITELGIFRDGISKYGKAYEEYIRGKITEKRGIFVNV